MSSTTGDKIERDNYPTPVDVINAMLAKMGWRPGDIFLEPCRGDESRIYDRVPLPESQKDWAEISMGRDYLAHDFGRQFDVIITNPPFIIPRPRFAKKGTDSCEYAWMVWDRGGRFDVPNGISHLLTRAA